MFHCQSDGFVTQAIKDTIPYFLGAVSEEALALENERTVLKRKLTFERRRLEENRSLMGWGFERAIKLIGEAKQVGLIDTSTQIDFELLKFLPHLLLTGVCGRNFLFSEVLPRPRH